MIVDNKLCPFCLLHDKDKPCGARQKPASVACTASGCRGRHAQKLHDLLKDIFREEGQVHVLQEDDGWEESEEAWELGGAEGMIVGAVRQEEEYSWQDVCEAWEAQEGEMEASVHQVRANRMEIEQGEENVHRRISEDEQSETEAEGLLVEGEEREYVLELLMREVPPNLLAGVHPAKAELATLKGKRKKNLGKKLRKKLKMAKSAAVKEPKKEGKADAAERRRGQAIADLSRNPEAKGRGSVAEKQAGRNQSTAPPPTSGGECSG